MDLFLDPQLLRLTVTIAAPFIIAAVGELITERGGVLNVAIEGQMAVGAAVGFLVTFYSHSYLLGLAAAMGAAGLMSLALAIYGVTLRGEQITAGLGLFVFGLGFASLLYRATIGIQLTSPRVDVLPALPLPGLSALPVLGTILFSQDALVYFAFVLAVVVQLGILGTPLGLRLRACGENPRAADTLGVNVALMRYGATLLGGLLIGLAGAYLPLVITGGYSEGMVGGRGWIALMLVILGRWLPFGAVGGALLFAYIEALQFKVALVARALPPQFFQTLPYLVAIVVLVRVYRGAQAPAALARPYDRELRG
jgi:general nucleoside transport system permease protein